MRQQLADPGDEMILLMVGTKKNHKTDKQSQSPYVHANSQ